jgi:acyl-CoA thioesterase
MVHFADLIQLRPGAENLWAGEADTVYSHPAGQFGGWTAAVLLKAAMLESGDRGAPLSITTLFTDAVGPGPIEVRTRLLRAGARLQFWRAEVAQRDKVCAHAQITFGQRRPAKGFTDAVMPELAPPNDPRMISFVPPTEFGKQLEACSLPWPPDWKPGTVPARSIFWARHKGGVGADHCLLAFLADFAPPRPMLKTGKFMFSSTVSMNIYFHGTDEEVAAVGDGYALNDTVARRCEGGYFDHELHLWSPSGALLMTSEQVAAYRD